MQAQGCELDAKQKHSAGSGTDNSPQPWANHLEIPFFSYMSITLRMHLFPRAQFVTSGPWLCGCLHAHHFKGSQQLQHLYLLVCKTGTILLISGSSIGPYLQNTLKMKGAV